MSDSIRKLNKKGIESFRTYINHLRNGENPSSIESILNDPKYSRSIKNDKFPIEKRDFATRYDMGLYLKELFKDHNMQPYLGDTGFWSWIALYWFDILCPPDGNGNRKPSKYYNYILSSSYNHRPRHAILTTWRLVNDYGETARFLLSKEPDKRGDLIEQLAARQYYLSCRGIIEAAAKLYYDPERQTFKRGSTSQNRKGNMRRFVSYLQQLELTYDLYTLPGDKLIKMLPPEYDSFLKK